MAVPPDDVLATVAWLAEAGFDVVEQVGGDDEPFGSAAWTFRRGDGVRVPAAAEHLVSAREAAVALRRPSV